MFAGEFGLGGGLPGASPNDIDEVPFSVTSDQHSSITDPLRSGF